MSVDSLHGAASALGMNGKIIMMCTAVLTSEMSGSKAPINLIGLNPMCGAALVSSIEALPSGRSDVDAVASESDEVHVAKPA